MEWGAYNFSNYNSAQPYKYKLSNTTIATELIFLYANRPGFQSYCAVGMWSSVYHQTDYGATGPYYYTRPLSGSKFNFRIAPIGFRFGGKLGAFLEMGLGYKGLVDGGLFYTIHTPPPHAADNKKKSRHKKSMRALA